jgi:hypothetical protein
MRRVTKENLIAQIDRLRKIKDEQGQLSMSSEYTLQAYEMLLEHLEKEPIAWVNDAYLARGVVDGETGSEDSGPGYIPVYRI